MKVQKDNVIKNVETERELGDYISAGWKKSDEKYEEKSSYSLDKK